MSEFVVIQVGQCGNQIGSALWPLILQEYNVSSTNTSRKQNTDEVQRSISSFFNVDLKQSKSFNSLDELYDGKVKARAVLIDMEDSVVSRFKQKSMKSLFDKKCFVTNYPGSGNNWAEGFCEHGPKFHDRILKAVQYAVEKCDSIHGFLILFSTGGGTGSGLGSYVVRLLADYYPEIERFVCPVYPTGTEDVVTCPYNMLFATKQLLDNATCVFPAENRCLLEIVGRQSLNNNYRSNLSIFTPFEDMNSIIVNMILHLTSGSRFPGSLNFDMNDINTNMIPFPKLNFLSSGFSHAQCNGIKKANNLSKQLKDEYYLAACNRNNQLVKLDPIGPNSILLASTLIGRGSYTLSDMRGYTERLQTKAKFAPWSKKVVKMGLCNVAPYNNNLAMFSLYNTTSIKSFFEYIQAQFVKLYSKKANVHHYLKMSGFDYAFFEESHESIKDVLQSYDEIDNMQPNKMARLTPMEEF